MTPGTFFWVNAPFSNMKGIIHCFFFWAGGGPYTPSLNNDQWSSGPYILPSLWQDSINHHLVCKRSAATIINETPWYHNQLVSSNHLKHIFVKPGQFTNFEAKNKRNYIEIIHPISTKNNALNWSWVVSKLRTQKIPWQKCWKWSVSKGKLMAWRSNIVGHDILILFEFTRG